MSQDLKYQGESLVMRVFGGIALLVILLLALSSIIAANITGVLVGSGLLLLVLFVSSKVILSATFKENTFEVKYLIGNLKLVEYSQVKRIYRSRESLLPVYVYVIRMKDGVKPKKVTFHCNEIEFENLSKILKEKGINNISNKPEYLRQK